MISIKHKTFKILNKYIEINGIEKVNPVDISRQNFLDETRKFISDKNVIFNNMQPRVYTATSNNKLNLMKLKKEKSKFSNSSKSLRPFIPTKNYKISNKLIPNDKNKTQILTNEKLLADLNKLKNSNNNINNFIKNNKNITNNNITKNNKNIIISNNIKRNKNTINNNIKSSKDTNSNIIKSNKKSTNYKSNKNDSIHDKDKDSNKDNGSVNNIQENSEKKNSEDKDNTLPHETEQNPPGKFTKNKILEIKEEKEHYKKKEKKRKLFLFGKKTAELFKDKNFTIIFSGNEINNCIKINNINNLSSKTLNEENEENKINNYINMCQSISFFDKISEISSKDEISINRFEKKI